MSGTLPGEGLTLISGVGGPEAVIAAKGGQPGIDAHSGSSANQQSIGIRQKLGGCGVIGFKYTR